MNTIKSISLMMLIGVGCVDHDIGPCDQPAQDVEFTVEPFTNGFQMCMLKNIAENSPNVTIVIRTQSEFDQYIDCGSVAVDLSKYSILAGRMITPNIDQVLVQSVTRTCNEYTYHVEIGHGTATAISNVYHFAVIPKLDKDAKINFDVIHVD
jgi:hypothetical protein